VDEASSAGTSATAHPAAGPSSRMRDERARSPPPVPALPERGLRSEAVLDRDGDSFWSLLRVRFTGRSASRYARRAGRRTRSRKAAMFEGFTEERIETSGATIHAVRRGSGPPLVRKVALLDIVPTRTMFAEVDQYLATVYFHWFFLIQPHPFPERLIAGDPEYFIRSRFAVLSSGARPLADEAVAEYVRCFKDP